jgi:hypothetical protein
VSTSTRLRVLALLVGLVAAVAPVSLGLASAAGSAAAAASAQKVPADRYVTALVNKTSVKKGRKVTIHGAVVAPETPACASGVVLTVGKNTSGAAYKPIGTVTTDGAGSYQVKVVVTKKSRFRIEAPASDACVALQSPPRTVKVVK